MGFHDADHVNQDSFDRINQTCRLFSSSLLDHDTKLPQDVLERVWSLQYQGSDSELSQSDLTALITHFVKTMVTFAKSVAGFAELAPEQQVQVCSRSASQFIQFLLARCLGSKDPTEQLQWLLDIQRPQTSTVHQRLQLLRFETLYSSLEFVHNEEEVTAYKKYAAEVYVKYGISILHKGLVANLILLNQIHNYHVGVKNILRDAAMLIAATGSCARLRPDGKTFEVINLIVKLELMDKIFKNEDGNEASQSNSTADGGSSSSNQNPQPSVIDDRVMGDFSSEARFFKDPALTTGIGLTESDRSEMERLSGLFCQGLASQPQSSLMVMVDTFKNYTLYGQHPPRDVLPVAIKVFIERSRTIFDTLANELGITPAEKNQLWSMNCSMAVALHQVKISCAESGHEQLNYIMGHMNRPNSSENGSSSALPVLACSSGGSPADMTGLADLKPISFEEVNQGKLNPSDERVYSGSVSNLLAHLCEIIRDPEAFALVFILVLLNSNGWAKPGMFSNWKFNAQVRVLTLLQKHLISSNFYRILSENDFCLLLSGLESLVSFLPALCQTI